ncbi:MAG: gamma-glutamyl-gamma-aminobutyrate hydrolase family protein [Candidatus Neomarinimicrobiota bacterium]|nr:gamma-glutamyl-gamma-aminobutyrate hydrolase family protein [Candidatus Neomarinimicrobiota bacterium]RKY53935.1 MAG: gamma-glutamyl-gamma-aminobutyrate hydrolase family protein [Candidatus Neomarinimicrobiota bacterium]
MSQTKNDRPKIGINSTYMEDAHKWYKVPINYVNAVYYAGGLPVILPCNPNNDELDAYLAEIDGMVFTGGADYPADLYGDVSDENAELMDNKRTETDLLLVKKVMEETDIPVLGICAGHQLLAIAHGAKLIQHLPNASRHEKTGDTSHSVTIKGGKWLKSIFNEGSIIVNSNHHQAVKEDHFPSDFEITARADDKVIEAMEFKGERFVLGIQWHPERTQDKEHTKKIFDFFIKMTRERK